jgi:transcription elongation factor S-II
MEALELSAMSSKLKKLISADTRDDGMILDILELLDGKNVTLQQLKKSAVSKVVFKLRKDPVSSIRSIAARLVQRWRAMLNQKNKPVAKRTASTSSAASSTSSPSAKPSAPARPDSLPVEERKLTKVEAKVKPLVPESPISPPPPDAVRKGVVKLTGERLRDSIRKHVFEALGIFESMATLAEEIETAMLKEFGGSNPSYKAFYRTLIQNLRDEENPDFKNRVLTGQVAPVEIVKMKSVDMASNALKKQRDADGKYQMDAARSDWDVGKGATDTFKCGKCKQRKTVSYQKQTRSSDEPMTTFVFCVMCGNRWRC